MIISRQKLLTKIVNYNISWAAVGSLTIGILSLSIMNRNIFLLKDFFFYASLPIVLLIGKSKNYLLNLVFVLGLVLYVALVTAIFFEYETWQIYNMRQLLLPILITIFSSNLPLNNKSRLNIINHTYKLMIWVIIFGIFFLTTNIWEYIRLDNYFNLKGIPVDARGLSYMFYEPALNYSQRMVSTFLDPISLGHALAAVFIMAYFNVNIRGQKRIFILIMTFVGLILCFSKGALMQVILAVFLLNRNINISTRIAIPLTATLLVFTFFDLAGILIHINGFVNAITNINMIGHGLGLVGNYAKMFAENLDVYQTIRISDTFIGSVIGQLGIIGFILWGVYFNKFIRNSLLLKYNDVGAIIIVSQLAIAVLSENTLNFTSFVIPGLLGGILLNHTRELSFKNYPKRLQIKT